jgi:hypothetical protein
MRVKPSAIRPLPVAAPPAGPAQQIPARSVRLRIEEVVIHGGPVNGRYQIGDALYAELTRLLSERGLPAASTTAHARPLVDGGVAHLPAGAGPEAIGVRLAEAVYRELGR